MGEKEPFRVGVVLAGKLGKNRALRMLIVHMNSLQTDLCFELLPSLPSVALLSELTESKKRLANEHVIQQALDAFEQQYTHELFLSHERRFECHRYPRVGYVVISECRLPSYYYRLCGPKAELIALGHWKRNLHPPSIVEFALTLAVACAALLLSDGQKRAHYGTRGCLFDFTVDLEDARYKAFEGFICHDCASYARSRGIPESTLTALRRLAGKQWLLEPPGEFSPACIASSLGHNLFTTRGSYPSWWERVLAVVKGLMGPTAAQLLVGVLLGVILTLLGVKRN